MEGENGGCGTKMANLKKRLKVCWDRRVHPNKNMEESNKRSLLIQSETMDNTNNSSIRPPVHTPPLSPTAWRDVKGDGK